MSQFNPENTPLANEAALISVLMYMDIEDVGAYNGMTFSKVTEALCNIYDYPEWDMTGYYKYLENHEEDGSEQKYRDRQRQYRVLANAAKNNTHLANMRIDNQSNETHRFEEGGLEACTFTDSEGHVIFAYRGTGGGEWIDNGQGLGGGEVSTDQQREALAYFDEVINEVRKHNASLKVIVTGHSKGGNKAQFVTMNSENGDLIQYCYNFDGQGMSPEAIQEFIRVKGKEEYLEAVNKMYGFYADNDFVNGLGIPIVPKDHCTYFKSAIVETLSDTAKNHFADDYLKEDGAFSDTCGQGALSMLIEKLSEDVMGLPPSIRSRITNAAMGVAENKLGNGKPVKGDKVTETDYELGLAYALTLVLPEVIMHDIPEITGELPLRGASKVVGFIGENIFQAARDLDEYAADLGGVLKSLAQDIINGFNKLKNWIIDQISEFGKKALDYMGKGFSIGGTLQQKIVLASAGFSLAAAERLQAVVSDVQKMGLKVWDRLMAEVSQSAGDIMKATKDYVHKKKEQFIKGVDSCISAAKDWLDNSIFGKYGFGITKKAVSSLKTKICADLDRLSYLQGRMRAFESSMGKMLSMVINEASRVTDAVGKNYGEYNVQQQIRQIRAICDEIGRNHRIICELLESRANGLGNAYSQYRQLETQLYKKCYGN